MHHARIPGNKLHYLYTTLRHIKGQVVPELGSAPSPPALQAGASTKLASQA